MPKGGEGWRRLWNVDPGDLLAGNPEVIRVME